MNAVKVKKYGDNVYRVFQELYGEYLYACWVKDHEEFTSIVEKMGVNCGDYNYSACNGCAMYTDEHGAIIMLKNYSMCEWENVIVLSHECNHATFDMLQDKGVVDSESHEAHTYLHDWCMRASKKCFDKIYLKEEKKKKLKKVKKVT